jgi:hypothetical protein
VKIRIAVISFGCVALFMAQAPTAHSRDWDRWVVYGRVTDGQGNPVTSATVVVYSGFHTMLKNGPTTTDVNGEYRLAFGPGHLVLNGGVKGQGVHVCARKEGFYERNLSRHGEFRMADSEDQLDDSEKASSRFVFPDVPKRVDFVLVSAATIQGRVVDPKGNPVADLRFYIDSADCGPGASVLGMFTTDSNGRFTVGEIPLQECWFRPWTPGKPGPDSNALSFSRSGEYSIELVLGDGDETFSARILPAEEAPKARKSKAQTEGLGKRPETTPSR